MSCPARRSLSGLDCSCSTQQNPDVFSEEVRSAKTTQLLWSIRKDVDTVRNIGGACRVRPDIERLVITAREKARIRSILIVTEGVLLAARRAKLPHLCGLICSLDSIAHDPCEPLSKSAIGLRVIDNLLMSKHFPPPRAITPCCMLELWNRSEAEWVLTFCSEHGFLFAVQSARTNGKSPNFSYLQEPLYRDFVHRVIAMTEYNTVRSNGTPKLSRTLLLPSCCLRNSSAIRRCCRTSIRTAMSSTLARFWASSREMCSRMSRSPPRSSAAESRLQDSAMQDHLLPVRERPLFVLH